MERKVWLLLIWHWAAVSLKPTLVLAPCPESLFPISHPATWTRLRHAERTSIFPLKSGNSNSSLNTGPLSLSRGLCILNVVSLPADLSQPVHTLRGEVEIIFWCSKCDSCQVLRYLHIWVVCICCVLLFWTWCFWCFWTVFLNSFCVVALAGCAMSGLKVCCHAGAIVFWKQSCFS